MKNKRRDFLKIGGLTGLAAMTGCASDIKAENLKSKSPHNPLAFNMSGYAAPALEKVCIGFVGLGNRGPNAVERMSRIEVLGEIMPL